MEQVSNIQAININPATAGERDNLANCLQQNMPSLQLVDVKKSYALDGECQVTVYKPFGDETYFAIVDQNGRYPGEGRSARNVGRKEYSIVLDGEFQYQIDGVTQIVKQNESVAVGDGSRYSITGKGKLLVYIHDEPHGSTVIESQLDGT